MPLSPEQFFQPRLIFREELALFQSALREKDIEVWSRISARLPATLPGKGDGLRDLLHEFLEYAVEEAGARALELRVEWREEEAHGFLSVECEVEGDPEKAVPAFRERCRRLEQIPGVFWEERSRGGAVTLPPVDLAPRRSLERSPEPGAEPLQADEPVQDPSFAGRYPYEVMVVDDSDIGRRLTSQILRHLGYEPREAAGGPEALQRLKERPCGLVFMDLRMPDMDGCETVQRLREATAPLPVVIALTAEISESERQRCLNAGMVDFLTKPCRPDELAAAIRHAAAGAGARPLPGGTAPGTATATPRRRWEDAPALNPATVRALRLLPGTESPTLFGEMVVSLERETPEACRAVETAYRDGDTEKLRHLLHQLTGNFEVIGALQLARLCRAASEASQRGDAAALERLLPEIAPRFEALRGHLTAAVRADVG